MAWRWSAHGHGAAVLLGAALVVSCGKDPQRAWREHVKRADRYAAAGKYKEAIVEYRSALQQVPQSGDTRYKLAETYVKAHEPAAASGEYVRAADLLPANVEALLKAGHVELLAGHFEDAKARAEKALALDANNVEALILRGAAFAGLKDLDSAIAQVEEAASVDPDRSSTYDSLAALYLAKGKPREAEADLVKAAEIDDKSVSARLMLAVFYLSAQRAAEAETALQQALAIEPSNASANRALATLYLTSRRAAEAEPYLRTYAEVSKTAAASLALADYYASVKRLNDALRILEAVSADDAQAYAAAQTRLAAVEFTRGQWTDARKRLDDTLRRQPTFMPGLMLKARFFLAENRLDEALAQANAAVEAAPQSAQAQFLLGRIYVATNQFDESVKAFNEVLRLNPRAAAAYLELARVQLANGNVDRSIQSARQAVAARPDDPDAHLLLARALIVGHDLAPAEAELKALIAKFPNAAAVYNEMGAWRLAKGDRAGANNAFQRALALDAESITALSGMVQLDLAAKRSDDALAKVASAIMKNPADARVLMLASATYLATGDVDRAEQALRRVIEISPSNIRAYEMLGNLFMSEHKLEQARAEFETMARRSRSRTAAVAAQTMVAITLEGQNKVADAQRTYEQILAASPHAPVAANNLAWLYAERGGNLDVALTLAQTAVAEAPNQPEMQDTLGWICYKKDLPSAAIAAFQLSIKMDSANPAYYYHLGLAYLKTGDRTQAKHALGKAFTLKPDFDGSVEARRVLSSITR